MFFMLLLGIAIYRNLKRVFEWQCWLIKVILGIHHLINKLATGPMKLFQGKVSII